MDLLWFPSDPAYGPLEVPYLYCNETPFKYDYEEFSDYPSRCGWDKQKMLKGDFGGRAPDVVASFLQSWLYFAAAAEILTDDADGSPLLPGIETRLTTTSLSGSKIVNNDALLGTAQKYAKDNQLVYIAEANGWIRVVGEAKVEMERRRRSAMRRMDLILDEVSAYRDIWSSCY
jgi:hypothetical protein